MGARYYAAWLGRWTSADPLGIGAGLGSYTYCRNGPITHTDPGGLLEDSDLVFQADQSRDEIVQAQAEGLQFALTAAGMAASFAFAEFLGGINTTAPAALDEERNEPRFNSMTEGEAAKNVVVNEVIGAGIALGITRTVGRFAKYLNKTDDVARVVPTEAPVARLGDESPTTPLSVGNEGGASHDKLRKILESMGEPEPSLTPIAGGSTSAGPWTKLNERKVGDEVAQLGDETCGHACVEYMAGVPQKQLIQELGSHSQQAHEMSRHLGPNWIGGAVPNTSVEANLLAAPKDWMAMLKSPMAKAGTPGHYVVVKGSEPSDAGMLTLKDPHGEGTTYEMTVPEFLTNWTRQFLFKKD